MTIYRVGMKICAEDPSQVGLREFVPVFHRWIQRGVVEGPLLDVVDYSHVSGGPGVLLAAFDANYSVDLSDGMLCFVGYRKRPSSMSLEDTLLWNAKRVVALCAELEAEPAFQKGLRFAGGVVQVFSNDRLLAPNTDSTEAQWRPALQGLASRLWEEPVVRIERGPSSPQERFCVTLRSSDSPTAGELHKRLNSGPQLGDI